VYKKNVVIASMVISIIIFLSACGQEETNKNSDSSGQNITSETETNTVTEKKEVYVDESKYTGDELALVNVLNQSIKFRNEGNETEYMALISDEPDTPINQMNTKKIEDIQVDHIGDISEKMGTIQATITTEGVSPGSTIYVFHKVNNVWKIYDID